MTVPVRCLDHAERLEAIEGRLGRIEGQVTFIADVLRPHANGATLSLEAGHGKTVAKIRGSAPWVVAVLLVVAAVAGGSYWATTASATTGPAPTPPASAATP